MLEKEITRCKLSCGDVAGGGRDQPPAEESVLQPPFLGDALQEPVARSKLLSYDRDKHFAKAKKKQLPLYKGSKSNFAAC